MVCIYQIWYVYVYHVTSLSSPYHYPILPTINDAQMELLPMCILFTYGVYRQGCGTDMCNMFVVIPMYDVYSGGE